MGAGREGERSTRRVFCPGAPGRKANASDSPFGSISPRPRPSRPALFCLFAMDAFLGIKPKEPKATAAEASSSRTSPSKPARKAGAGASSGGPPLEASIPWVER